MSENEWEIGTMTVNDARAIETLPSGFLSPGCLKADMRQESGLLELMDKMSAELAKWYGLPTTLVSVNDEAILIEAETNLLDAQPDHVVGD